MIWCGFEVVEYKVEMIVFVGMSDGFVVRISVIDISVEVWGEDVEVCGCEIFG